MVVLVLVVVSEGFLRPESRQRLASVGPDARARARAKCTLCLRARTVSMWLCAHLVSKATAAAAATNISMSQSRCCRKNDRDDFLL